MLETLKNLIFGLNEYEKVKIDDRLQNVLTLIPTIRLNQLEDFEILEKSIYKLKEQLRIKSSNLNRVVAKSSKLRKKDVLEIIERLEAIKYDFLKKMFASIEHPVARDPDLTSRNEEQETSIQKDEQQTPEPEPQPEVQVELANSQQRKLEHQETLDSQLMEPPEVKTEETKEEIEEVSESQEKIDELVIEENDDYKLMINNGKMPYLLVQFNGDLDLVTVKHLATIFFDTYQCQGTNIIVEDSKALILARHIGDELIDLPRVDSNLDEIYEDLKKRASDQKVEKSKAEKPFEKEEDKEGFHEVREDQKKRDDKPSAKHDDASLDALLEGIEDKKPQEEKEEVEEKPEEKEEEEPKPDPVDEKAEKPKKEDFEDKKEEDKEEKGKEESDDKSEEKEEPPKPSEEKPTIIDGEAVEIIKAQDHTEIPKPAVDIYKEEGLSAGAKEHEVYRDDKIVAFFREDSQVKGELVITPTSDQKISDLNESDLSYISIFSKVFATVLFETQGAHGTNLLWDFNSNALRIIPRVQDDNININLTGKNADPNELENLKEKLLEEMRKEVSGESKRDDQKSDSNISENDNSQIDTEMSEEEKKSEMEEKAKYVLNCLKRVP